MLKSVFLLVFTCFITAGNYPGRSMQDVLNALRKGDAGQISRHMDEVVRITLEERTHPYSKTQSEAILRNFFRSRTIIDLSVVHQSDGEDGEIFVGDLRSSKDRHRVSIIMRSRGDRMVISELRLERP
jgi:hypothetical protein